MSDPFHTTRWSIVLAAGNSDDQHGSKAGQALETLCQTYWFPLYAYIRRRCGDEHQAQDLTQAFFHHILDKATLADANPQRGRFRSFLLTACKHFITNEWDRENAKKRGGDVGTLQLDFKYAESNYRIEPSDPITPEIIFEREWAIALLNSVLDLLKQDYRVRGKEADFDLLKPFLHGNKSATYSTVAAEMGTTEGSVKVAVHRLRTRYRELIRAEIEQTVESSEHVEDEIRRLFEVLSEKSGKFL